MNGICLLKGISSDANWKGKDKVLHVRLYRYKIIITNFTWKENIIKTKNYSCHLLHGIIVIDSISKRLKVNIFLTFSSISNGN
jgi:hypothetical protein